MQGLYAGVWESEASPKARSGAREEKGRGPKRPALEALMKPSKSPSARGFRGITCGADRSGPEVVGRAEILGRAGGVVVAAGGVPKVEALVA